jgi:hypothetical protein
VYYDIGMINGVDDLATMTNFDYGTEIELPDGTKYIYAYWDGSAPATAIAKGDVLFYGAGAGATVGLNPRVTAPATTAVQVKVGVACQAKTAAGGLWLQIEGPCAFASVLGAATVAVGRALQCVNGQVYLADDGGTVLTADTVAYSQVAYTTTSAALKAVYLLNRAVTIG